MMSILNTSELTLDAASPGVGLFAAIPLATSTSLGTSFRAGQRRLRAAAMTVPIAYKLENSISPEALNALIKYGNNKEKLSALTYAINYAQDWKAAEALIEAGIGINSKDDQHQLTPIVSLLSLASSHGYLPYRENATILLRKIIEKGIDISVPMNNGFTQGQHILWDNYNFFASPHLNSILDLYLTKYKIDLNNHTDPSKWRPIQGALQFSNLEAIKILMKHGAKVSDIDCFCRLNPTGSASQIKETINFLISQGANPLITSASNKNITAIDYYLKRIIELPSPHYDSFKETMIPFLMNLGAKIR